MITNKQRRNAETIVRLADQFGDLYFNAFGQTPEKTLDLTIPCARLIVAGVVTGVADTNDAVTDGAVEQVRRYCREAVEYATSQNGAGWWTEKAKREGLVAA